MVAVGGCWDPGHCHWGFWGLSALVTWQWPGVEGWVVVVRVLYMTLVVVVVAVVTRPAW